MPIGFIYIVTSLRSDYTQRYFCNVPTEWNGRLYFGPCKKSMRPKIKADDYIFGISPSSLKPRRIVFVAKVQEILSFRDAYNRFPDLRGPKGPIHVRPVNRVGRPFPESHYEHISDAMHCNNWKRDLKTPDMDAFLVCYPPESWLGIWLGKSGPEVNDEILNFLKTCSCHNQTDKLSNSNEDATTANPIVYKNLYIGLHLETDAPQKLIELCAENLSHQVPPNLSIQPTVLRAPNSRRSRPVRCSG